MCIVSKQYPCQSHSFRVLGGAIKYSMVVEVIEPRDPSDEGRGIKRVSCCMLIRSSGWRLFISFYEKSHFSYILQAKYVPSFLWSTHLHSNLTETIQ